MYFLLFVYSDLEKPPTEMMSGHILPSTSQHQYTWIFAFERKCTLKVPILKGEITLKQK